MSGWQPIESAPKGEEADWSSDRPRLILTDGKTVSIGRWDESREWTNEAEIRWLGDDGAFHETRRPTHWQPLPDLPAA